MCYTESCCVKDTAPTYPTYYNNYMILYYQPACPYCQRVINFAQHAGVSLVLKNIGEDHDAYAELLSKGGKAQVPFLLDIENSIAMYESANIIGYLESHHGN